MVQIPVPNEDCVFDYTKHHRHILFCGTVMIHGRCEANSYLKAVVIRTGSTFNNTYITHYPPTV